MEFADEDLISDIRHRGSAKDLEAASMAGSFKPSAHYMSRQAMSYFILVEARIKELEAEVSQLKQRSAQQVKPLTSEDNKPETVDEQNAIGEKLPIDEQTPGDLAEEKKHEPEEKPGWVLKPAWKTLYDFHKKRDPSSGNIVDVLLEPMGPEPLKIQQKTHKLASKLPLSLQRLKIHFRVCLSVSPQRFAFVHPIITSQKRKTITNSK